MNKKAVEHLFSTLQAIDPEPQTELNYSTPFELLIAVLLSAQATDVGVNKATAKLYPIANTPEAFLKLGEEGLKKYINTIGLYNSRLNMRYKPRASCSMSLMAKYLEAEKSWNLWLVLGEKQQM